MVANKYAFLQITRSRFLNEWEAFKKVISRRNIRRRITIPLTLSNLKLLRRITRTENILHRNFTRRQVAIQNRVASNIGISQSRSEERFSRNAETDLVCRLLLEKKKYVAPWPIQPWAFTICTLPARPGIPLYRQVHTL